MILRSFAQFVDCVIHWECHLDEGQDGTVGVYSNTPGDAGGPTRFGVTMQTRNAWRAGQGLPPASIADMMTMPLDEAVDIYHDDFYIGPALDRLPDGTILALEIFDIAVGSGPGEAIRILQEVLQSLGYPCTVDGAISTNRSQPSQTATQAAKAWTDLGGKLVSAIIDRRIAVYKAIPDRYDPQGKFLTGWDWRAERLRAEAEATPAPATT